MYKKIEKKKKFPWIVGGGNVGCVYKVLSVLYFVLILIWIIDAHLYGNSSVNILGVLCVCVIVFSFIFLSFTFNFSFSHFFFVNV